MEDDEWPTRVHTFVVIVESDEEVMRERSDMLEKRDFGRELTISSAHRNAERIAA